MIALVKRLPEEITNYFYKENDMKLLDYFTERKLRPLTLLESDDEKIRKFDEMREALGVFN